MRSVSVRGGKVNNRGVEWRVMGDRRQDVENNLNVPYRTSV